jgi:hypothetical protein
MVVDQCRKCKWLLPVWAGTDVDQIGSQSPKFEPADIDDREYRSPSPIDSVDQARVNGASSSLSPGAWHLEQFQATEGPWTRLSPRTSSNNLAEEHPIPEQDQNEQAGQASHDDSSNSTSSEDEDADDENEDEDEDSDDNGLSRDGGHRRRTPGGQPECDATYR